MSFNLLDWSQAQLPESPTSGILVKELKARDLHVHVWYGFKCDLFIVSYDWWWLATFKKFDELRDWLADTKVDYVIDPGLIEVISLASAAEFVRASKGVRSES